ncbi:serine kinase [Rhodobacteraceae bacterium CCMM004]|nr:serine kinase [Rhodobacteraceae bacterium CCMM004]
MAGAHTPLGVDEAQEILRAHYGREGTLTRFETEKDDTFRVTGADGRRHVLKISNADEDPAEVDLQNAVLEHVAGRDPALPVPRVVPDVHGRRMAPAEPLDGPPRLVRLLTYLDGTPLCETESTPAERVQVGRILARLRLATAGFSHPGASRVYAWDVQHLPRLADLLDEVADPAQRAALTAGMSRFLAIADRLDGCRRQVLHNDFSKSNIVVDHDAPHFVTGIIDFGDTVHTAIAVDVSTALLNQLPETPDEDLFARGRDVLRGYLEVADLTDNERALIPHLVMGRVVARALLTLWRARLFPGNRRYILRNTEQGWHQLDWFLARDIDTVSQTLMPSAQTQGSRP